MKKDELITIGVGLIGLAVTPTPDDVTVVSPLAQLVIGAGFIVAGMMKGGNK